MAVNKKPTAVDWRWVFEERFIEDQTLSPTALGNSPNNETRLHRANARELSLGVDKEAIHCRQRM